MSTISGITYHSGAAYVQETKPEQAAGRSESMEKIEVKDELQDDTLAGKRDGYICGEEPKLTGVYQISRDEDGNTKIMFEDPNLDSEKKTAEPDDGAKPATETAEGSKEKDEKCTVNTDSVDAEIKKLKEEIEKLEHQVSQAEADTKEQENLRNRQRQLEFKLSQKNNDAYRRQHAQYS